MLIRFEVANFRSILDPVELSMVAVDQDRSAARPVPNLAESLLTVAGIYGPNASGKSNVLAALAWLVDAVRDSLRSWDDEIPLEPFAFPGGADRPSEFTIELVIEGVRFEYVAELDRDAVRYEGLFHYPEKKRRRIFVREDGKLKLQRGLGSLSGTRELLTARTLALSAARRFDEPLVATFANALLMAHVHNVNPSPGRRYRRGSVSRRTLHWFDESSHGILSAPDDRARINRGEALALLRLADLGIDDVVLEEHEDGRPEVRFLHRTATGNMPLDLAVESEGTRTWFELVGPVLTALNTGSLLLIDELDASLHPRLSAELIRLFQEAATNQHGAQLVFTSHDTSLLNHLNRDEVWLTEKGGDGATRLGALAEFAGERVRRSRNLENAYLHGRFGALPDIDRTEILRSLGLVG